MCCGHFRAINSAPHMLKGHPKWHEFWSPPVLCRGQPTSPIVRGRVREVGGTKCHQVCPHDDTSLRQRAVTKGFVTRTAKWRREPRKIAVPVVSSKPTYGPTVPLGMLPKKKVRGAMEYRQLVLVSAIRRIAVNCHLIQQATGPRLVQAYNRESLWLILPNKASGII